MAQSNAPFQLDFLPETKSKWEKRNGGDKRKSEGFRFPFWFSSIFKCVKVKETLEQVIKFSVSIWASVIINCTETTERVILFGWVNG